MRSALSRPLVTTLLFMIPVSRVSKILSSAIACLTIGESSSPLKNRLSNPIIRSHLASFPTFSSTIKRNSLIGSPPGLDTYLHALVAELYLNMKCFFYLADFSLDVFFHKRVYMHEDYLRQVALYPAEIFQLCLEKGRGEVAGLQGKVLIFINQRGFDEQQVRGYLPPAVLQPRPRVRCDEYLFPFGRCNLVANCRYGVIYLDGQHAVSGDLYCLAWFYRSEM